MSPPSASASIEGHGGVEDAAYEQRVVALAATRLAHEASAALRSQAQLVDQVQLATASALMRITDNVGSAADILRDVAQDIIFLRDLAGAMQGADAQAQFCRPDVILDHIVAGASERAAKHGVKIDYVRSFSNFTMFGAPTALVALMSRCIDVAVQHCGGETLRLRANFYDAQDGRRMLRLVISAEGGRIDLSAPEVAALAAASKVGSVTIKDGSMIVMLRAPLAAPARLLSAQADIEAHGV